MLQVSVIWLGGLNRLTLLPEANCGTGLRFTIFTCGLETKVMLGKKNSRDVFIAKPEVLKLAFLVWIQHKVCANIKTLNLLSS